MNLESTLILVDGAVWGIILHSIPLHSAVLSTPGQSIVLLVVAALLLELVHRQRMKQPVCRVKMNREKDVDHCQANIKQQPTSAVCKV